MVNHMVIIIVDDVSMQLKLCKAKVSKLLEPVLDFDALPMIVSIQHLTGMSVHTVSQIIKEEIEKYTANDSTPQPIFVFMDHHLSTVNNVPVLGSDIMRFFLQTYPELASQLKTFIHSDDAENPDVIHSWSDISHSGALPKGLHDVLWDDLAKHDYVYSADEDSYSNGLKELYRLIHRSSVKNNRLVSMSLFSANAPKELPNPFLDENGLSFKNKWP